MSILFSRHCEYALQAITYIAMKPPRSATSIKELASKLEIPYHFLAKILQDLKAKGLLFSQKGPRGGFGLANQAQTVTLLDVVNAIDGLDFSNRCVMGFTHCSDQIPCAAHAHWSNIREGIYAMLAEGNLKKAANAMKKPGNNEGCLFVNSRWRQTSAQPVGDKTRTSRSRAR
jgi:Rrf2 family transcriptional regulator, iron-sulfur cluster assembly transcription factor